MWATPENYCFCSYFNSLADFISFPPMKFCSHVKFQFNSIFFWLLHLTPLCSVVLHFNFYPKLAIYFSLFNFWYLFDVVMLKILQARLQQYVNWELSDVQAGFRKGRGTRDQLSYPMDHRKSKRVPEKHLFLPYWLCQSLWLCGSQLTVENSERDGNTRPPDLTLEKPVCRSRSNS